MSGEVVEKKIPWHWIIPLVIILSFTGVTMQFFQGGVGEALDIGKIGYLHEFPGVSILAYFFIIVFAKIKGNTSKISNATLAYLFAVTSITALYSGYYYPTYTFGRLLGTRYIDGYGLASYIPSFWAPSKEAITSFMTTGGSSISPEWAPVIIYWSTFAIVLWLCLTGFAIFFRRQWLDIENLPYPYAAVSVDFVMSFKEQKESRIKLLLIGTLIGFIFYLMYFLRGQFSWFPDLYGWFNSVTHNTGYWGTLRPQNVFPSIYQSAVGLTQITYNPFYIALALFIPLHTLFSASFFYIVYIIIGTQIAFIMGYYTGMDVASDGSRADMLRHRAPINISGFIEHAVLPATLVMAIVLNYRNTILTPLKLALSKGSSDLEKKEPASYRAALIMILASSIILVSMLTISGLAIEDAFIWLGMAILMLLSFARVRGFAGPIPVGDRIGPLFFRWKYPSVTMANVPRSFFLYGISYVNVTSINIGFDTTSISVFESLRVGSNLGVNNRNLLKVMLVSVVIASFIGLTSFVAVGSYLGIARSARRNLFWDNSFNGTPMYIYTRPSPPPVWPWLIAGTALAIALSFLHHRFVWWPLEPIGAFIGCGGPGVKIGLGWVFIIAYIIKYLVMKFGGAKVYTDTVMPLATGFIAGSVLSTLVGAIIGIIRFISPM